jgi:putative NADPH-quinone reductase
VTEKLNKYCSYVPAPPRQQNDQRKVLVISAHPLEDSFSVALSDAVQRGLEHSGHTVRVRTLYQLPSRGSHYIGGTFNPVLQPAERKYYHDTVVSKTRETKEGIDSLNIDAEVKQAIEDIRWCDSIVFVFPTW